MIRFYCRGCGKELWTGFFRMVMKHERLGHQTLKELWDTLFCCDCAIKKFNKEEVGG